ncbi:hypothetical protein [Nostoc sp. CCY 9925]|uniref:hypothetical protein n=1 Tax=Nostoc sp. CCY 9925 TaxID=3103865 RepID=UPI0039C60DE4
MEVKTITFKRVLNIGNFENKHLELSAQIGDGEDDEEAISLLMEKVERKLREPREKEIVNQIQTLESRANSLRERISYYEERLGELKSKHEESQQQPQEPDPDDIPFEGGEAPKTDNTLSNF